MIQPQDLLSHAATIVRSSSETDTRRAISASYYALFHTLTEAGSAMVSGAETPLAYQTARAFNHATMRKVCEWYVRSRAQKLPAPLDILVVLPIDARLGLVAATFVDLQDARHTADYNLSATLSPVQGAILVGRAAAALGAWSAIASHAETTVFLTALLHSDRWTRRG